MRKYIIVSLIAFLTFSACEQSQQITSNQVDISYLREGFKTPPLEARPRALWDWVDGNFSLDEITNEMEEAVAKGMGGFDIWDVRKVVDENNIVPAGPAFMSDVYLEGIIHAINEAERLEIDLGLIIASGWNAGGAWTKPEHQTMGLFQSEKTVKSDGHISAQLAFPELPTMASFNGRSKTTIIPENEDGTPVYYKEIRVLAIPMTSDSATILQEDVHDISDKMDDKGHLSWDAPEGEWRIIRYVCANTGQPMISSTPNSAGPMIDHFNPEATAIHINYFIDKIEEKLGKPIGESGLKYFYTDSYEVTGLLWTERLIDIFEQEMGYSVIPFLPVFEGFTVESNDVTNRFLYDFRKVWSDLIINSHYKQAREICESHGIGFVAEAAGPGMPVHNCPFESLKSSGCLSFPRGEFWHVPNKNPFWEAVEKESGQLFKNDLQVIKGVACGSHIYNQKYVEAEAFTGLHIYSEGPGDLKPTADRAFAEGLNRIVFHTWPHTPKVAGTPGWSYTFGTLMHENRIWWPKAKPWIDYLARNSYMLQQGNFVGDILYFYGDSVPNFVPAKHIDPSLGFGYDYDVCNSDILINKLVVKDGKLTLPHGQSYEVLALPENKYMTYDVLEKVAALVKAGAVVVGQKPTHSHGLKDWEDHDQKVIKLANELWGDCDGGKIKEHIYGKGKIVWGKNLKEVLGNKNIGTDFDFFGNVANTQLDFIHRTVDGAEIYFITNASDQKIFGEATFRVTGRQAEMWNSVTGAMNKSLVYSIEDDHTRLPLLLEPNGSIVVVFTNNTDNKQLVKIEKDGQQIFPTTKKGGFNQPLVWQDVHAQTAQLLFSSPGEYTLYDESGTTNKVVVGKKTEAIHLEGAWQLHFPKEQKGAGDIVFEELESWTKSALFDVQFFSGIATYEKQFTIPAGVNLEELSTSLDLGDVRDLAHVFINGKDAGVSWVKPHITNISDFVTTGENTLRIEVANTWHNRLSGDAKLPEAERLSRTNLTRLPNPWSYPMKRIPIDDEKDKYDLLDAGLLGPVIIHFNRKLQP